MRYLAMDLGGKRTGLAVGNDTLRLAQPLEVLHTSNPPELLRQLATVIEDQGPDALVVGLPLNMDGTLGPAAKQAQAFAGQLRQSFHLPVYLFDERLTSYAADQVMSGSGLTHGQKKARRDALAAAALLQDFLTAKTPDRKR